MTTRRYRSTRQQEPVAPGRCVRFRGDLSAGDDKDAAQVIIKYKDARRGQVVLDVNASEVDDIARKGQKRARRGRKPKTEE